MSGLFLNAENSNELLGATQQNQYELLRNRFPRGADLLLAHVSRRMLDRRKCPPGSSKPDNRDAGALGERVLPEVLCR